MNKTLKFAVAAMLLLLVASCDRSNSRSIYSGFEKMENGAYMKFYERGDSDQMPRLGDGVTLEMIQYFDDTLLLTQEGDELIELRVEEHSFVGDLFDALRMMHVGDSARLVVLSDSIFHASEQMYVPEEYFGKPIYFDMRLLSVKPFEEIAAERRALLDSLMNVEDEYLMGLMADKKNTVTESGLVILEKSGKGKTVKLGEYMEFDLMMCTKDGDTLVNSFGIEPFEWQYGEEEFLCKGFDEALSMLPQGGMMNFVIPSSLAFDSLGYQGMILPYAPLVVKLKMNAIMDNVAYEKKQAALEAEQKAEMERLMALEKTRIAEYIAANGITETPTESGLYIITREEGEGNLVQWGDEVTVHYMLKNLNDDVIESSYNYDQPISFTVGKGEMIPAIEEALMTMAPGAKVKVVTPSSQAFGEIEIDKDMLPAYSPLVIELELVAIE